MSDPASTTLTPPARTGGIVILTERLLQQFGTPGSVLECREGQCHLASAAGPDEVTLSKSLFRPVLARVAAMCNERRPGSVSPYGGEGELAVGDPARLVRVRFTNTTAAQQLEILPPA